MAWAVDTCIILDVANNDPSFGRSSASWLQRRLGEGLVVCPVTTVELAPQFQSSFHHQEGFLRGCGIDSSEPWLRADTLAAHAAWARYVSLKRAGATPKRPIADILIGAFACRFQGLVTRNPHHFTPFFPGLTLASP